MRSNVLLFFHILVAMTLLGGLIASAVTAFAAGQRDDARGDLLRKIAWRSSIAALVATIATIVLGEGLSAYEDIEATWLDASRGLATFGLLLGGAALAVLAHLARSRPPLIRIVAFSATALSLLALAVAFVMSAKPS